MRSPRDLKAPPDRAVPLKSAAPRANLAWLALAACAALIAVRLAREVAERETVAVDASLLESIHSATPAWLQSAAQWITGLGNGPGITMVVVLAALVLWRHGRAAAAAVFSAGAALTALLVAGLKELVGRARPDLWPHVQPSGESFPSGHAVQSAMVYGTLAVLLARRYPQHRAAIVVGAVMLVLSIAATRAILGVHWPTDLLAGLAIGVVAFVATVSAIDSCERDRPP